MENINYNLRILRFYVYPEFIIGKRLKFFFNIGPYLCETVNSSYSGSVREHENPIRDTAYVFTGTFTNFKTIDAGLREGLGISYPLIREIILSLEENGSIGVLALPKSMEGAYIGSANKYDIGVILTIAYKIQKKKTKNLTGGNRER
jgi:hypothetical protein